MLVAEPYCASGSCRTCWTLNNQHAASSVCCYQRNNYRYCFSIVRHSSPRHSSPQTFITKVLTSPGYPGRYPNNYNSTQTIQVAPGKGVKLHFTHYNCEGQYDYVHIVDDEGHDVYLYELSSGIIHREIVDIVFHTDSSTRNSGWRLEWTEV